MSLKADSSASRPSPATRPPSASRPPAAAPQRTPTPSPQRAVTRTAPRDTFVLSDPRARGATSPLLTGGAPQAARVRAVDNTSGATGTAAYRTQKQLSEKRQALGKDMQELEGLKHMVQQAPILGLIHGGKMDKLSKRIDQTKQEVQRLEAVAKTQPADEVQRASFQVFNERLASLEAEVGKSKTARLARQTYYNDKSFNASAGTLPASEAELLKAGFPTSPLMKAPNGDLVDVGHVACGLDWQVNPSALNRVGADLEQVTLTGDLGAATLAMGRDNLPAAKALNQEASVPDLNGDIDGLNLATRLRNQPNQSLADAFKTYYGNNPKNRVLSDNYTSPATTITPPHPE